MAIENIEVLKTQMEVSGFPPAVYNALDEVSNGNFSRYQLEHRRQFGNDRMYCYPQGNVSKNTGYYNGYLAVVVNNMPENPYPEGDILHGLESRLQNPPTPEYHAKIQQGQPLNDVENYYGADLQKDMLRLLANNRPYFLRLVALYNSVLPADVNKEISKDLNEVLDTQVRKQWFAQEKGINIHEAYTMLKEPAFGINFVKETVNEQNQLAFHWVGLNYSGEKTKYGNYNYVSVDTNDFDLDGKLQHFLFKGADSAEIRKSWIEAMERGEKVLVAPVNQQEHAELLISANAAYQTIHIQGQDGQLLKHDQFLTEAAKQQREENSQAKGTQQANNNTAVNGVENLHTVYSTARQIPLQRHYPAQQPRRDNNTQNQGHRL